ncbi:DHA2 family efflux MFS transporter permease subunit [Mesorhizobium sp. B2-8-3]|uniref:DHA2 family efflux MFS transporter permease subunit n=1 Tax=Mesorhizobium sp. B2-8-3 TaxID=2589905 RepID=UPI001FEF18D4|nr:DHA2 family efflux MFS transporter permease subunit [Mesorhizobium sp. B2-8-3]
MDGPQAGDRFLHDGTGGQLEQHLFATERDPRLKLIIPAIVAIAFLMEQLDSTILTTAIPAIAQSLDTTPVRLNLAITTYILTLAVFIPVSGWFADRFGARKIFALALFTFTLGSVLCGVADSVGMLLAMRALQGLGGAMMTPVGRLILLRSFPRSGLITAMTYMTLPAIVGPVIGPLLGGLLTTYASWRWIFYVNVPFGLIGIFAALRFVDDFHGEGAQPFDFAGFLMVGAGAALLQFGLENIGRPIISSLATMLVLAASVLLLLAFGRYARRVAAPAVDLTLFRFRSFWVGTLAGGLCRIGLNGAPFLLPLMLQVGFGMSPVTSGSLTFVGSFGALLMRPLLSFFLRRFGFKAVLSGSAVVGSVAVAGFALLDADSPHWLIGLYVFFFGIVRSAQFMSSNTLSYADLPGEKLSRATSLGGVLQQLSVSLGVSIAAMVLGLVSSQAHAPTADQFHWAFLLTAVIPLLSIPGFFFLHPEDGQQVSGHRRKAEADA